MNRIVLAAAGLLPALAPSAALAQGCAGTPGGNAVKLVTQATGLRSANGEVAFTVYPDDRRRFLAKGAKLLRVRTPARSPATTACFWLPPGHYAVALYHDENGDGAFNRTLWVPKEGFGFSNDASTTLGLPRFEAVRFALPPGGTTMRMATRYRR